MNYADIFQPTKSIPAYFYNAVLIFAAAVLIAFSAQAAVNLPFSPVPVTAQTLAVFLTAAYLGKRRGLSAVGLYLASGAVGLPVFAGGKAGLAVLLGPTGGYLLGFAAAAFVVGYLMDLGWDRSLIKICLTLVIGNLIIYLSGLAWLSEYIPLNQLPAVGLIPFLIGDLMKIAAAAVLLTGTGKIKTWLQNLVGSHPEL